MISIHSCPLGQLGGRDTGGMNVYVRELALELGRNGQTIDIFTKKHSGHQNQVTHIGERVRLIHLDTEANEDMPKVAIYASLQDMLCGIESFRKNDMRNYDAIHSHYWLSGIMGAQLQMWWNIPHMTMFHTLGIPKNIRDSNNDEPELRIETEKEVIRHSDRIIAATEQEKTALASAYGAMQSRIAVVPCGVNLELFKPTDTEQARHDLNLPGKKYILFVGRFEHVKGLHQLVKAMSLLNSHGDAELLVIGGDEHSEDEMMHIRGMSETLHIENRVHLIGSVEQQKLPAFYSAADVCVIPSYYESFGMVALESLACGTPVVAADVGGMRQIIVNDTLGSVAPSNDPSLLAEHISSALSRKKEKAYRVKRRSAAAASHGLSLQTGF
jgi:D-inositol-3-phosphate glycosyltransferase